MKDVGFKVGCKMCNFDFPMVKNSLDILQSIAVTVASVFAAFSFNQWRKELVGKRKIELAEEMICLFSKFPNVISSIRNPVTFGSEGQSLVKGGITPNGGDVALERLSVQNDYFTQIDAIRYRFLAYFGQDQDKWFNQARKIIHEIKWAAMPLRDSKEDKFSDEDIKKYKSVIWAQYDVEGRDDELQQRAESVKDGILGICAKYLQ